MLMLKYLKEVSRHFDITKLYKLYITVYYKSKISPILTLYTCCSLPLVPGEECPERHGDLANLGQRSSWSDKRIRKDRSGGIRDAGFPL